MKIRTLVISFAALLALASPALAADTYQIDPVHSRLGFTVRHLTINNVEGRFMDFSGTVQYDEQDITKSSANVTIKATSVNTENNMRDNDLRSANFFDVTKYPTLTFQSSGVEKQGDGYVLVGTLTMHGVSKPIKIPFTILGKVKDPWGNTRVGLEGSLTINRQDYGINYSKTIDNGGLVVSNEVKIQLNIEAVKK